MTELDLVVVRSTLSPKSPSLAVQLQARTPVRLMSTSGGLPVSISQLHFSSEGHQSLSHILSDLRRSALSVTNRLKSIEDDSRFVEDVARHFGLSLPLVANERCGSWYIPPDWKKGSAYFKSTDGHTGQWDFSLRRLNLQVLDLVSQHGG